ncbi:MAG: ETC complex I subunit [Pseudomonadota bacterium]
MKFVGFCSPDQPPEDTYATKIYSPTRSAMQSGKGKTGSWVLEYERESARRIEPLMGYTSSSDMRSQLRLTFDTREDAVAYAEREGIPYTVSEPKQPKRAKVSYAENFSADRRVPWTH